MVDNLQIAALAAEEANALPVDQLGLLVLADLIESNEWNIEAYYAWLRQGREDNAGPIIQAVAEAVGWLLARGLLVRDPRQQAQGAVTVTRLGRRTHAEGPQVFRTTEAIQTGLHPAIEAVARPQFLIGQYEQGVFASYREIEIRVRDLSGFGDEDFGVSLMNKAFANGGPLADANQPAGEQEATHFAFAGTYGMFRNPSGHRQVHFEDIREAAEMVHMASLLMRVLDRIEARLQA